MEINKDLVCLCNGKLYKTKQTFNLHKCSSAHMEWESTELPDKYSGLLNTHEKLLIENEKLKLELEKLKLIIEKLKLEKELLSVKKTE